LSDSFRVEQVYPKISFARMVALAFADDGSSRAFLVLQPGRVMEFDASDEASEAQDFLDIRDRVNDRGNEEGLLGLALDPEFQRNGHFYVYYTASDPRRGVLSRFTATPGGAGADAGSELVVLEVAQPYQNHNGGQVLFGPDGHLYLGLGDGGSRGDPRGNGQDPSTLLGTILRLDVRDPDSPGAYSIPSDNPFVERSSARGEIWAYGLRNPWRFTLDRLNGDLWAADVGQNRLEEIDIIQPGRNYGWSVMEGGDCHPRPQETCNRAGLEPPVGEYGRDDGCSITGGYVYRGARLTDLYGAYIYGDFCSGKIWALTLDVEAPATQTELVDTDLGISSFAEDPAGELYILSFDKKIYRLAR
jgi:glucose/arabinose dehydrogenase